MFLETKAHELECLQPMTRRGVPQSGKQRSASFQHAALDPMKSPFISHATGMETRFKSEHRPASCVLFRHLWAIRGLLVPLVWLMTGFMLRKANFLVTTGLSNPECAFGTHWASGDLRWTEALFPSPSTVGKWDHWAHGPLFFKQVSGPNAVSCECHRSPVTGQPGSHGSHFLALGLFFGHHDLANS